MAEQLIGFGFWRSLQEPSLPDPAWFIDEHWSVIERHKVSEYLGQGRRLHYWMGFSWCRFRCETNDGHMGACDLTDGTYCWPEGLTHYIMEHQVRLPDEIVRHILSQSKFPSKKAAQAVEGIETDTTWWQQQQGWCPASSSFLSGDDQEEKDYLRRFDRNQTYFNDTSEAVVAGREELIQSLREKFGNG